MHGRPLRSSFVALSLLAAGAFTLAAADARANGFAGKGAEPQAVDNGQPCTLDSECVSRFCVDAVCCNAPCGGSDPKDCQACSIKAGALQDGVCGPARQGESCDDGNGCTGQDACVGTICLGSVAAPCLPIDQCHDAGLCNPATGQCSTPAKFNGAPCNDGDACTKSDVCVFGACTGQSPVVCTASDQCHDPGVCDAQTGLCSNPGKAEGAACDDGDPCTQSAVCQAGVCSGGDPVSCVAIDQCHEPGTCDKITGACTTPPRANGSGCNDGDGCTQQDTCQAGICVGAQPVVCVALDACHDAGTCAPATGVCSDPPKADGTSCNDGNDCNTGDRCLAGSCKATSGLDCDDGNPCTVDGCNVNGACTHTNADDATPCSDQNACTKMDSCQAGVCQPGATTSCKITECILSASCDPLSGACVPMKAPDGDACIGGTCSDGACVGGGGASGAGGAEAGSGGDAGASAGDAGAAGSDAGTGGSSAGSGGAGTAGMAAGGSSAGGNAAAGSPGSGNGGAGIAGAGIAGATSGGSAGAGIAGAGGSAGASGSAGATVGGGAGQTGSAGQVAAGQAGGGGAASGMGGRGANGGRGGGDIGGVPGTAGQNGSVGVNGASLGETDGIEGGACVVVGTSAGSRSRPWAALGSLAALGALLLRRRTRGLSPHGGDQKGIASNSAVKKPPSCSGASLSTNVASRSAVSSVENAAPSPPRSVLVQPGSTETTIIPASSAAAQQVNALSAALLIA